MNGRTRFIAKLIATSVGFVLVFPVAPATAAPTILETSLTGAAEVPGPGDADAFGAAEIKVNVKKEKVCFTLVVLDLTLPTAAAHIHEGEAGVAGDIVVTLEAPAEIAGSGVGLATGCVGNQPRPLLRDIKNNPDQYYVNVHTSDFPDGAVRGQLAVA
jgi:hypothetical protein